MGVRGAQRRATAVAYRDRTSNLPNLGSGPPSEPLDGGPTASLARVRGLPTVALGSRARHGRL